MGEEEVDFEGGAMRGSLDGDVIMSLVIADVGRFLSSNRYVGRR